MKKWKVSNLIRGYQIEENYVLANDEDEAYEKMEDEDYIGEWKIVKDEMSTEDTEITEVKNDGIWNRREDSQHHTKRIRL